MYTCYSCIIIGSSKEQILGAPCCHPTIYNQVSDGRLNWSSPPNEAVKIDFDGAVNKNRNFGADTAIASLKKPTSCLAMSSFPATRAPSPQRSHHFGRAQGFWRSHSLFDNEEYCFVIISLHIQWHVQCNISSIKSKNLWSIHFMKISYQPHSIHYLLAKKKKEKSKGKFPEHQKLTWWANVI